MSTTFDSNKKARLATSEYTRSVILNTRKVYYKGDIIKSANLFLTAWRISESKLRSYLHTELETYLTHLAHFMVGGKAPAYRSVVKDLLQLKSDKIIKTSLYALHDFTLACYYSIGQDYRDEED
jgi:hypothetical protein